MKKVLFLLFVSLSIFSFSQTVVFKKKDALVNDVPTLSFKKTTIYIKSHIYDFFNKKGDPILQVQFYSLGQVSYTASFTKKEVVYGCSSSTEKTIEELLESYYKNGVLASDSVNIAELKDYCELRGFVLSDNSEAARQKQAEQIQTKSGSSSQNYSSSSSYGNSTSSSSGSSFATTNSSASKTSTSTASPAPVNKSFTLKNNSSKTVRIFAGTKPKYGSGKYEKLGGNTITNMTVKIGDQFCIVDDSDNPISCTTISESTSRIDINSAGNGFGN